MGLKDLKLFPMEQISVTKIQGRTNTRQPHPVPKHPNSNVQTSHLGNGRTWPIEASWDPN